MTTITCAEFNIRLIRLGMASSVFGVYTRQTSDREMRALRAQSRGSEPVTEDTVLALEACEAQLETAYDHLAATVERGEPIRLPPINLKPGNPDFKHIGGHFWHAAAAIIWDEHDNVRIEYLPSLRGDRHK